MDLVCLVTGASSGIGRSIAIGLAPQSATIYLLARNEERLKETKNMCIAANPNVSVHVVIVDLSSADDISRAVNIVRSQSGRLNVLVHNAGVSMNSDILSPECDMDEVEHVMNVNLLSVMRLTKLAVPLLLASESQRHIFAISSQSGVHTHPKTFAYCASKHGLQGFLESIFEDLRNEGVKVTSILPGYVDTPMISSRTNLDVSKAIDPSDIACLIQNLLQWSGRSCPTRIDIRPQRNPRE
ncbi:hypothetical protein P9112_012515 [Eukaryota sp. TZLM1-RC]